MLSENLLATSFPVKSDFRRKIITGELKKFGVDSEKWNDFFFLHFNFSVE